MSEEIKAALKKIVKSGDMAIGRGVVLAVDKDSATCQVQLVANNEVLNNVNIKPIICEGDLSQMGIILYPSVNAFVLVGNVNQVKADAAILSCTLIESIELQTPNNLLLQVSNDGTIKLNASNLIMNNGDNDGIPLVKPLTKVISDLQNQVNQLITAFTTHTHTPPAGPVIITPPAQIPGLTAPTIQEGDIANPNIKQ